MKHWLFLSVLMLCHSAHATSVWLNDWTSPELQEAIAQGTRTILIPTAGTEQNGPYLPLGKHHFVVHEAAQAIAKSLDKTLVAPILDYVPEGTISPPQGHMRFAGTLSLQEATYEAVLEDTARSFKQ
ncbi:MAG: creatininase family protein, partial [Rickettsiales bacterium]|nr:creatininase family protein [Rickettsiales bacterium]